MTKRRTAKLDQSNNNVSAGGQSFFAGLHLVTIVEPARVLECMRVDVGEGCANSLGAMELTLSYDASPY